MQINSLEFGRLDVRSIPLPENVGNEVSGTYTYTGRVLVAARVFEKGRDYYRVFTIEDTGEGLCPLFEGEIPQKPGANGIRWMCFADNSRVLLGDYVLECSPDLDHPGSSRLFEIVFPPEIAQIPGLFMRWSEPIISPDNTHICFSSLTGGTAYNFLGSLVRSEQAYAIQDLRVISTTRSFVPDGAHPGCYLAQTQRGGEVKQFIRGGLGISVAGGGNSISESRLQMLDSEAVYHLTDTLGYEETAILSPDETCAICMSPRFSPATDAGVLGVVPLIGDLPTRAKYLNVLYQYAIAGVRAHRSGNIGPALIHVERSLKEGRAYTGENLSDPEGRWVYYSPMSWHPDSRKALWNERTRPSEGAVQCRLRVVERLDAAPTAPVPAAKTPDGVNIPYSEPLSAALQMVDISFPIVVHGQSGTVTNGPMDTGAWETRYDHYSVDGETYYDGYLRVQSPENMFQPGVTQIQTDITVSGAHTGRSLLRLTLRSDAQFQIYPDFGPDDTGAPRSCGYAEYDGVRRDVADLAP